MQSQFLEPSATVALDRLQYSGHDEENTNILFCRKSYFSVIVTSSVLDCRLMPHAVQSVVDNNNNVYLYIQRWSVNYRYTWL